jgi:hypothetical protein
MERPTELGLLIAAIPARNEEERIEACLSALDGQVGARFDHIVLLVNNSHDRTASVVQRVQLHPATKLHLIECTLPPEKANAGHARRLAMKRLQIWLVLTECWLPPMQTAWLIQIGWRQT